MKIARIRTYALHCPFAEPIANAQGRYDSQAALLVRITTQSGIDGWGECYGPTALVQSAVLELLAPQLLGQDATAIETLWQTMWRSAPSWARRGVVTAAISGIDIALWDILGHFRGLPICELLGGRTRDRVPCYASGLYFLDRPEAELIAALLEEAHTALDEGYRGVKVQIGRNISYDMAILRTLRREFPNALLFADACRAYDLPEAMQIGYLLDDLKYGWFEEPLASDSVGHFCTLSQKVRAPVAMGECLQSRWEYAPFLSDGGVTVGQINLAICGGISEAQKIRTMATGLGINMIPQTGGTMINFAAALHFLASGTRYPGRAETAVSLLPHESPSVNPLRDAICETGIVIDHGVAMVPTAPGLGICVDESALRILCLRREEVITQ